MTTTPPVRTEREVLADLFVQHLGEWQARWWPLIDAILETRLVASVVHLTPETLQILTNWTEVKYSTKEGGSQ